MKNSVCVLSLCKAKSFHSKNIFSNKYIEEKTDYEIKIILFKKYKKSKIKRLTYILSPPTEKKEIIFYQLTEKSQYHYCQKNFHEL